MEQNNKQNDQDKVKTLLSNFTQYMVRKNWSHRTIETYTNDLKQFFKFIHQFNPDWELKNIIEKDIHNYQSFLFYHKDNKGKNYSMSTQIGKLGVLKSFFRYLQEANQIIINPTTNLQLPKAEKKLGRRALKPDEIERIFKKINCQTFIGYRDRVILELLYTTGIRVSELINLKVKDIHFDDSLLFIEQGKGKKDRYVPLCEVMKNYLNEYLDKVRPELLKQNADKQETDYLTEYLFLNQYGQRITRRMTIDYRIKLYYRKAGMKGSIGAHNFRVTCGSEMLKGGASERYVQEILGHSGLEVTERYLRIGLNNIKAEHGKRHPRK